MKKFLSKYCARSGFVSLVFHIFTNRHARINFSLFWGALVNILYIIFNLLPALTYENSWALTVTLYYFLLFFIRVLLLRSRAVKNTEQYKICKRIGLLLLLIDFLAASVMVYTVFWGKATHYSRVLIIFYALFFIYCLTTSVFGIKRSLLEDTPLSLAAGAITLTSALVSLFNLVYSILTSIDIKENLYRFFIFITGAGAFLFPLCSAIYLIVRGGKVPKNI